MHLVTVSKKRKSIDLQHLIFDENPKLIPETKSNKINSRKSRWPVKTTRELSGRLLWYTYYYLNLITVKVHGLSQTITFVSAAPKSARSRFAEERPVTFGYSFWGASLAKVKGGSINSTSTRIDSLSRTTRFRFHPRATSCSEFAVKVKTQLFNYASDRNHSATTLLTALQLSIHPLLSALCQKSRERPANHPAGCTIIFVFWAASVCDAVVIQFRQIVYRCCCL